MPRGVLSFRSGAVNLTVYLWLLRLNVSRTDASNAPSPRYRRCASLPRPLSGYYWAITEGGLKNGRWDSTWSHCTINSLWMNLNSIGSLVSRPERSHFHFWTARSAACASTGCPPITVTDFAVPFGATTTSSRTAPFTFIVRANSGYAGTTRLMTRRGMSAAFCWPATKTGTNNTAPNENSLIRTLPRNIDQCPSLLAYV